MHRVTISNVAANSFSTEALVVLFNRLRQLAGGSVELELLPGVVLAINEDGEISPVGNPRVMVFWHCVVESDVVQVVSILHEFLQSSGVQNTDVVVVEQSILDTCRIQYFVNGRQQQRVTPR